MSHSRTTTAQQQQQQQQQETNNPLDNHLDNRKPTRLKSSSHHNHNSSNNHSNNNYLSFVSSSTSCTSLSSPLVIHKRSSTTTIVNPSSSKKFFPSPSVPSFAYKRALPYNPLQTSTNNNNKKENMDPNCTTNNNNNVISSSSSSSSTTSTTNTTTTTTNNNNNTNNTTHNHHHHHQSKNDSNTPFSHPPASTLPTTLTHPSSKLLFLRLAQLQEEMRQLEVELLEQREQQARLDTKRLKEWLRYSDDYSSHNNSNNNNNNNNNTNNNHHHSTSNNNSNHSYNNNNNNNSSSFFHHASSTITDHSPKMMRHGRGSSGGNSSGNSSDDSVSPHGNSASILKQPMRQKRYYMKSKLYFKKNYEEQRRRKGEMTSVVFLGAGEGGKATIHRHIQNVYNHEFDDPQNRAQYIIIIHHNIVMSMYALVSYTRRLITQLAEEDDSIDDNDSYGAEPVSKTYTIQDIVQHEHRELCFLIECLSQESRDAISTIARFDEFERRLDCCLSSDVFQAISHLWHREPLIRFVFDHYKHRICDLHENADYWFGQLSRVTQSDYIPSMHDLFKVRVKTTGVLESDVHEANVGSNLNVILMGSHRSERKKWMAVLRERKLGGVLFVVGLSEYNQNLYEDDSTNRLHESMQVFCEMMNSSCLTGVPVYLFLNKVDVFVEKLRQGRTSDLSQVFPHLPFELSKQFLIENNIHLLPGMPNTCCTVDWEQVNGSTGHERTRAKTKERIQIRTTFYQVVDLGNIDEDSTKTSKVSNNGSTRMITRSLCEISGDALSHVCSFMNLGDLCRTSLVNAMTYAASSADFIWENLYYAKLQQLHPSSAKSEFKVSESVVKKLYDTYTSKDEPEYRYMRETKTGLWKFFFKYVSHIYYKRNIDFVLEELLDTIHRRDIRAFLTNSTTDQMTYLLRNVLSDVALANLMRGETKKRRNVFSRIRSMFQ